MNARTKNCFSIFWLVLFTSFWLAPPLNGQEKASLYINVGLNYYEIGQYEKAVEKFQKALTLDPDHPHLHGFLGSALLQCGKIDQAIEAYERQIVLAPTVAKCHYNLGLAYLRKGLLEEAIN